MTSPSPAPGPHVVSPTSSHPAAPTAQRLTLAMTGASGACYGVRLLQWLAAAPADQRVQVHLIVTPAGWQSLAAEMDMTRAQVESLADVVHQVRDIGACVASGSFHSRGMVIAPCSMRTLAAIAHGLSDNLVTRAADVALKERRRLLLLTREAPLNLAHLRNMQRVTEMGAIVFPPVPAFYQRPTDIQALIDHTCGHVLQLMGFEQGLTPEWRSG